MSNTTRERIIDEAMRLFSERGYAATSVAKIETGAGLTAGAGGLYHHFKSKEAVLAAGIERRLSRLDALREIRQALGPLGDLKAELHGDRPLHPRRARQRVRSCASLPAKRATARNC